MRNQQRGFCIGPTQTELKWMEVGNLRFRKKRNNTFHVVKTKALLRR